MFHLSAFRPYLNRIAQSFRKLRELACLMKFILQTGRRKVEDSTSSRYFLFHLPFQRIFETRGKRQLQAIIPQDDNSSLELLLPLENLRCGSEGGKSSLL